MKKQYALSLNFKKAIIEIDHDIFDKNEAWKALQQWELDIENYEGTMDTILRWIGVQFCKHAHSTVVEKKALGIYVSIALGCGMDGITVVDCDNMTPAMLDFAVREIEQEVGVPA